MSNHPTEEVQPIGLDVGSSRIVVARNIDGKNRYQSQLNAFLTVPYSKLAANLLEREGVAHEVQGPEILITGQDAQRMAEVFQVPIRRPMLHGVINPQEPHALAVLQRIIGRLVGRATGEGQKIFFSVPAQEAGDGGIAYHKAALSQILTELGYRPTALEEGLAVVLGELDESNFTGIGVSCGSGMCNVCLAVLSMPVISFSISRAGDFIDAQSALITGDLADQMRLQKERSFGLNGFSGDRVHNAINVYYQEMIGNLVDVLRRRISAVNKLPRMDKPVPLVLSGGTAMPRGFLECFEGLLRSADFPLKLSELRVADDPLNSTARGALMAALV